MNLLNCLAFIISKKKILFLNIIFVTLIAIVLAFSLQKYYKSDITFLPPEDQGGLSVSALLNGEALATGDNLLGNYYKINADHIRMIMESKDLRIKLINKFDLISSYKLEKSKKKYLDALAVLDKRIVIKEVEHSGLGFVNVIGYNVSITDTSANRSYEMVSFFFGELQKFVMQISNNKASTAREFIENLSIANRNKVDETERRLLEFQKEHKVLDLPLQTEEAIKVYSDLQSAIFMKNMQLEIGREDYSNDARNITMLKNEIATMNRKIKELENKPSSDYMISLGMAPELALDYLRLRKDVEIYRKLDLLLCQQLEYAKIQEAKSISCLQIIDSPHIPEYKYKPKRILLIFLIVTVETICLISILVSYFYYKTVLQKDVTFVQFTNTLFSRTK